MPGRAGQALGPIDQVCSLLGPRAAPGTVAGLVSVRHGLTLLMSDSEGICDLKAGVGRELCFGLPGLGT